MSTISDNLDRRFYSFIDNERPVDFFKGLAEYLEYALSQEALKAVVDAQMSERDGRYAEILRLQEKSWDEMQQAKKKLIEVVEETKVDVASFRRFSLFAEEGVTVLQAMERYEEGIYMRNGWPTNNLRHFLFEIAANLRARGHENKIMEFVPSQEEYTEYHRRITGPSELVVFVNDSDIFIFSKTWPECFEAEALLDSERKLKSWGDFETLLQFNRAYRIARENGNFMSVFQEATMNPLQAKEAGEVAGMVEDMLVIMGDIQKTLIRQFLHGADPINYLDVNNFKSHSHIAHNRFMSAADKSFMDGGSSTKNDSTIKLDHINKITCIRPKDNGKKYQAVVNDDYANPLTADRVKRSFDMLFRVAEGEKPLANEYKSNIDYFNTNKQNRFYTQTGLGLTKIFKVIDGDVCPNIIMEVISEKALATRRNTPVKT